MKRQDQTTQAQFQNITSRDWTAEVVCATVIFLVIWLFSAGTPDLLDAIVSCLMG